MANTKATAAKKAEPKTKVNDTITETSVAQTSGAPSYDELAALVKSLSQRINELEKPAEVKQEPAQSGDIAALVGAITNRKSDREVVIVHGCEVGANLSTHIELSTLTLDMRTLGEERTLSWSQFEECVSKYRSFFTRGVIKVGAGYEEVAERYNVPCVSEEEGKKKLLHSDMDRIPGMTPRELEDFVMSLNERDKNTVISYCLGKCYEKESGFYDRYKMEVLGRIAKNDSFAGLILIMNGDEARSVNG